MFPDEGVGHTKNWLTYNKIETALGKKLTFHSFEFIKRTVSFYNALKVHLNGSENIIKERFLVAWVRNIRTVQGHLRGSLKECHSLVLVINLNFLLDEAIETRSVFHEDRVRHSILNGVPSRPVDGRKLGHSIDGITGFNHCSILNEGSAANLVFIIAYKISAILPFFLFLVRI